ncbi:hypothetical protein [Paenibacillus glycinis]|uniref:Uncharacterized protein n=1 Tax=Paenibacillus glycinis TaxID=2697035 RepID=A0ABW9XSJ5_9BACL|nr:hypothetical protein [Paenibacillus glycinis]NBD25629.1 hypothetical protein [Paenibacillus glycinis]
MQNQLDITTQEAGEVAIFLEEMKKMDILNYLLSDMESINGYFKKIKNYDLFTAEELQTYQFSQGG